MGAIKKFESKCTAINWQCAIDYIADPMVLLDINENIVQANKAFLDYTGKCETEITGLPVVKIFHPQGEDKPCPACRARAERRNDRVFIAEDSPHNHRGIPYEVIVSVLYNDDNEAVGFVQTIRDVEHVKLNLERARKNEERFRVLLESAPDALVVSDRDGKIILTNKLLHDMFGYSREELNGRNIEILLPENLRSKHAGLREQFIQHARTRPMGSGLELFAQHRDGHLIDVEISLSPIRIDDEYYVTAIIRDITEEKQKQREIERLATFPELSPLPVIELNRDCKFLYCNPAASLLFNGLDKLKEDHIVLNDIHEVVEDLLRTGDSIHRDVQYGDAYYEQHIVYLKEFDVVRIYSWDITVIRELANKMTYQALHDSLTGLINRKEFEHRLSEAIREVESGNKAHALCFIDLDQFKVVNDSCGHDAGDELLKQLAELIKPIIRESDTLARLGGDEFGVLLKGCALDQAEQVANNFRKVISDYKFIWHKKVFSIGASIGVVPVTDNNPSMKELLKAADMACFKAKDSGRNKVHVYTDEDIRIGKHTHKIEWVHRIQQALEEDNLVLFKQKIMPIDGSTDKNHIEILLRMLDENCELIMPGAFLPIAERFSLMGRIDKWVVHRVFDLIRNGEIEADCVSINVSGQSIADLDFLDFVISELDRTTVPGERICFEFTESVLVENLSAVKRFVSILKGLGCKFALDDFGSGVSSFNYVKYLDIDSIKIDRCLINNVINSKLDAVMVKSINQISHAMGIKTVAEFVDSKSISECLKLIGVDYLQGYVIEKPTPLISDNRDN